MDFANIYPEMHVSMRKAPFGKPIWKMILKQT